MKLINLTKVIARQGLRASSNHVQSERSSLWSSHCTTIMCQGLLDYITKYLVNPLPKSQHWPTVLLNWVLVLSNFGLLKCLLRKKMIYEYWNRSVTINIANETARQYLGFAVNVRRQCMMQPWWCTLESPAAGNDWPRPWLQLFDVLCWICSKAMPLLDFSRPGLNTVAILRKTSSWVLWSFLNWLWL